MDGEEVITDLMDGLIEALESGGDAPPGHIMGQAGGFLQAQADMEQSVDDPVEQVLAASAGQPLRRRWPLRERDRPGSAAPVH